MQLLYNALFFRLLAYTVLDVRKNYSLKCTQSCGYRIFVFQKDIKITKSIVVNNSIDD